MSRLAALPTFSLVASVALHPSYMGANCDLRTLTFKCLNPVGQINPRPHVHRHAINRHLNANVVLRWALTDVLQTRAYYLHRGNT